MNFNLMQVTKRGGLTMMELAALLGEELSTLYRLGRRSWHCHRPHTRQDLWFLHDCPKTFVQSSLRRWASDKPKNKEHFLVLQQIAKRRFGPSYSGWLRMMQSAHPEFFN